jgi:tRNA 2-thiouridine synthesizing protein A
MSRSWLGRPTGRHAAPRRGAGPAPAKAAPAAPAEETPPPSAQSAEAWLFGAPTMAEAPAPPAPLVSPVTDEARAAVAGNAPLPFIPPGAAPAITIDALGRKCPIPIIMLAEQIRDVPVGAVIAVLADDPAAYTDIPAWCGLKSHECVFRTDHGTGWSFGILRRY